MPEVHSRFGYSAVSTYEQCPARYGYTYLEHFKPLPTDDPANPLVIGTALHKGMETDVDTAIEEYFNSYPVITDQHIDEEIKLRYLIPKVKEIIPEGINEVQVVDTNFIGTLDLLVPATREIIGRRNHICDECDGFSYCANAYTGTCLAGKYTETIPEVFDLYDFKYIKPGNQSKYMTSRQLHLYKYYFEKANPGKRIRKMYFIFIPKVQIKQKKTEDLFQFRKRLMEELDKVEITVESVEYDPQKVIDHLELTQKILTCDSYPKNPTRLCDWCDYKKYCQEGDLIDMALPSTQEVAITINNYKKIWIYGEPFSGKTHLAAEAPKPILELNTDGNIKHYTMPRISITDTKDGRQTIPAWEVFKNAVDDLEAGSDFKTVVLDLTEDIYDYCRKYICDKRGWEHESDDSFKAYDIVRSEFLRVIRKLVNLPYNIILISHQDVSKDITKRSGDKVTKIKPNVADKVANKLAGMVDIVIRTIKVDDNYTLSTKTSDVIFGGGRLTGLKAVDVQNCWGSIEEMYASVTGTVDEKPAAEPVKEVPEEIAPEVPADPVVIEKTAEEAPQRRTRRTRN